MDGPQVTDLKAKDFIRELENAIVYGTPYLLQDVEEVGLGCLSSNCCPAT